MGGVKLFRYPGPEDPCILIRRGEDEYAAYSQKCTHLSCAVYYAPREDRLECPCHEGYFSVRDGRVLQGRRSARCRGCVLERQGDTLVAVGMDLHPEELTWNLRISRPAPQAPRPDRHRRRPRPDRHPAGRSDVAADRDAGDLPGRPPGGGPAGGGRLGNALLACFGLYRFVEGWTGKRGESLDRWAQG